VFVPERNDRFTLGGIELKVLWPEDEVGNGEALMGREDTLVRYSPSNLGIGDVNQVSVVMKLRYGEFEGLFTGDITEEEERKLVDDGVLDEVELLKVAHHGSRYSSSSGFVELVSPEVALVSVGERNSFGHPTKEVIERLVAVGAKIHRTDEEGDVVVVSDGKRYWVEE
jgi:competence protein ComEC